MTEPADAYPWDDETPPDPTVKPGDPDYAEAEIVDDDTPAPTPAGIALYDGARLTLDHRDPAQVLAAVRFVRRGVVEWVRARAAKLEADRVALVGDRRPNAAEVSDELRELADAHEALEALSRALLAGRDEAASILLDLVEETGRRSARTGDGHGMDLVVKIDQRRELEADTDAIVAVVRAALALAFDAETVDGSKGLRDAYLAGIDDAIGKLRELLSTSPTWRTTCLDAFAVELSGRGGPWATLAGQLQRAYRRVDVGDPRAKIEHVEPKTAKAPAGAAS
jgi:hypothetical protein